MKHQRACEVSNLYSAQYNSFSKIKTLDDGQLGPIHVMKEKVKINDCIVMVTLICVEQ
jgi:hypothetical protein